MQSEFIKKQVQSNQQKVYFKLDQLFGDLYQDKYHPFFPDIVEESLSFTGQLPSGLNYFVPLKINLENIYHTTAVDTWSDEKKLALAQKALQIT